MMTNSETIIAAQRRLIAAIASYHRHDACHFDDCQVATEPHLPCDPGFLLVRQVQDVIDLLGMTTADEPKSPESRAA